MKFNETFRDDMKSARNIFCILCWVPFMALGSAARFICEGVFIGWVSAGIKLDRVQSEFIERHERKAVK